MGIAKLLIKIYPKKWQRQYGVEYEAMLSDMETTPGIIIDVIKQAFVLQVRFHKRLLLSVATLIVSGACDAISYKEHLTANILWAPTTLVRGVSLCVTLAPWIGLAILLHRTSARYQERI